MSDRAWPFLIVAVMLVVFYPAFSAEVCNVDDAQMLEVLQQVTQWSLGDIFIPGASGGLYYRPLLGLSFFINKSLFHLNPFTLHAENVLIHLANCLLVFFLARLLFALKEENSHPVYAFLGSLFFGLHPLVTESVNWISGRTDLLMGFFLLFSALVLMLYRINGRKLLPWFAAFFFLCALLSKELAIAFLPGYFLILYTKTSAQNDQLHSAVLWYKKPLLFVGVTILVIGTFFLLRTIAFTSDSSRIGLTLQYMYINPEHSFFLFLRAIGFYLKKLLIPWPLNFAIVEVDPLYELVAIPVIGLCIYIALKGTFTSAIFIAGLFLFSPALLIALHQIAWTPYAERYLYCTTAFVSIAAVMYCANSRLFLEKRWGPVMLSVFLIPAVITTIQRNLTWQTNQRILADTARKSPTEKSIQWLYGAVLFKEGNYQEALFHTQRAVALPGSPLFYNPKPEINLGYILYHLDRIPEAIAAFETVIKKTSDKLPEAHEGLIECYYRLWGRASDKDEKQEYFAALEAHGMRLFALRPDPLLYYNLGKRVMSGKAYEQAGVFFSKAVSHMQEGHEYLPFAKKLASTFQRHQ